MSPKYLIGESYGTVRAVAQPVLTAIAFLALATLQQFDGYVLAMAWALEGLALLAIGIAVRRPLVALAAIGLLLSAPLWAIIALLLIALFSMFQQPSERSASREVPFSQFLKDVDGSRVKDVVKDIDEDEAELAMNSLRMLGEQFDTEVEEIAGSRIE